MSMATKKKSNGQRGSESPAKSSRTSAGRRKPKLAVWKFASCDGCQLSILDCEHELLAIADAVTLAYFPEATRAQIKGPYDISLVEGSITTPHDAERIHQVRRSSAILVSIGACATAGGIQALRNFADVKEYARIVYASPEYLETLGKSTPISDHVPVEFELRGCPISKGQLVSVLTSLLHGRRPVIPSYSVCMECKRKGNVCGLITHGPPCLGPVTQAGCGALCPTYHRGCFGCFGPKESANTSSLSDFWMNSGMADDELVRQFRSFTATSEAFRKESESHEVQNH